MQRPSVSVILPTFNRSSLILRSLESIQAQTWPVHEIIVVDDGSEDETARLVLEAAVSDSRICYLRQDRAGAPAARNLGISQATGSLIAFQDSDDEWEPSFLEELIAYHTVPKVAAFSSIVKIDPDGIRKVVFGEKIDDVADLLARTNCISTQTVLLDARLLENARFDIALPRLQDWDLWLSLIDSAVFLHHPQPLAVQHIQSDSITSQKVNFYLALRRIIHKHWRVLARHPRNLTKLWITAWIKGLFVQGRRSAFRYGVR